MAWQIYKRVWEYDLAPSDKLVALALADHASADGTRAFPSKTRLAKMTGLSDRSVQRSLANLVEAGIIMVQKAASQHRPTTYSFVLVRGDSVSPLAVQGRQIDAQGRQIRHPGETQCLPNHKNLHLEPGSQNEITENAASYIAQIREALGWEAR